MRQNSLQILFTNEIDLLMKYLDIWWSSIEIIWSTDRQFDHHFKNNSKSIAPTW